MGHTELLLLLGFVVSSLCYASSKIEEHSATRKLHSYLMDDYNKDVRPTIHHTLPTNVTFGFLLQMIIDLDEKNQVLTTRAWLNINWMDERLEWNVSQHGNIRVMQFPHSRLWKPDIILTNNADQGYEGEVMSTDIFVTPKGNITWLSSAIFKSSCEIRVQYFPFDDQVCMINFTSWSHNGQELNLMLLTEEGDLSSYVNSSEFVLTHMNAKRHITKKPCCPDKPWPKIAIAIHLSRRPFFYVFNHIMPGALISSMALTGFLIPPDSGEKVTMCITTMLSMGVYLKTITEIIPPTSEAVPLVGLYYITSLFMVCCITMLNIYTLNLHGCSSRGYGNPIPVWARKYILGHLASFLRMEIEPLGPAQILTEAKIAKKKKSWLSRQQKAASTGSSLLDDSIHHFSADRNHPANSYSVPGHGHSVHRSSTLQPGHFASLRGSRRIDYQTFGPIVDELEATFQNVLDRVWKSLNRNEIRQQIQDEKADIIWEWKAIALIIDRFLLYIFFIGTTVTCVLILFQPAIFKDNRTE